MLNVVYFYANRKIGSHYGSACVSGVIDRNYLPIMEEAVKQIVEKQLGEPVEVFEIVSITDIFQPYRLLSAKNMAIFQQIIEKNRKDKQL